MKLSKLFGTTLRDVPANIDAVSQQLLLRAGYVRQISAGIFAYLPLGYRALKKIEGMIRQEIDALGGQEMSMPVVQPAELWQKSGRWTAIDDELLRFKDRKDHDMVLAMTHEEVVTELTRSEIASYRQLPQLIYQFQTKFRDEARPRAGLIRVREFVMKDSYSLDIDEAGMRLQYEAHLHAYQRIFERCGLPVLAVDSDSGMMGGQQAHEFMYLTDIGEDTLFVCDGCGYAANKEAARFRKPPFTLHIDTSDTPDTSDTSPHTSDTNPTPAIEKVATPDTPTIAALAQLLNIDARQTAKVVFFTGEFANAPSKLIMAVVRGDHDCNAVVVKNLVNARSVRAATIDEIEAAGAVAGYASPIGLNRSKALVVVDNLIPLEAGLVAGANERGMHLLNVLYGRDYEADHTGNLAAAFEGAPCDVCGQPLRMVRGVEVGNIFQLGMRYSTALGAMFADERGQLQPVVMGSYGIGLGRVLACVAEAHHDDKGLCWPMAVAPFQVMLVSLAKSAETKAAAEQVYASLRAADIEVLLDDRDISPGVKFGDADLIGLPVRLTVSERSLKQGGVELKLRQAAGVEVVSLDQITSRVMETIAAN